MAINRTYVGTVHGNVPGVAAVEIDFTERERLVVRKVLDRFTKEWHRVTVNGQEYVLIVTTERAPENKARVRITASARCNRLLIIPAEVFPEVLRLVEEIENAVLQEVERLHSLSEDILLLIELNPTPLNPLTDLPKRVTQLHGWVAEQIESLQDQIRQLQDTIESLQNHEAEEGERDDGEETSSGN